MTRFLQLTSAALLTLAMSFSNAAAQNQQRSDGMFLGPFESLLDPEAWKELIQRSKDGTIALTEKMTELLQQQAKKLEQKQAAFKANCQAYLDSTAAGDTAPPTPSFSAFDQEMCKSIAAIKETSGAIAADLEEKMWWLRSYMMTGGKSAEFDLYIEQLVIGLETQVKALESNSTAQAAEIAALKGQNQDLTDRVDQLEALITSMEERLK